MSPYVILPIWVISVYEVVNGEYSGYTLLFRSKENAENEYLCIIRTRYEKEFGGPPNVDQPFDEMISMIKDESSDYWDSTLDEVEFED